jgi:inhibitor of KinA
VTPTFKAVGDQGLLVSFADEFSDDVHEYVLALDSEIAENTPLGVVEVVPALVNLLVSFDPCETSHVEVTTALRTLSKSLKMRKIAGDLRHVDICYEGPLAADLAAVATATNLSQEAVINAHLTGDFSVLMYGFSPGYAYLSGVPKAIHVPRKQKAIRDVPAGSVIIADQQCLVTTLTMPTGWSRIGGSPTKILTDDPSQPFLFNVGDQIAFRRINLTEFEQKCEVMAHV